MDSQGVGCALCGGSPSVRTEQCYITEDSKTKLMEHAEELERFGVTLEERHTLGKGIGTVEAIGLTLAVADSLDSGVLRKLVRYLRSIAIPELDIIRLRLGEPEEVLDVLKTDEAQK